MARVGETQPADEVGNLIREVVAQTVNLHSDSQPLDCPGIRFDDQGMIVPHSILGDLEDFRKFLEAKGETELLKRIPASQTNPEKAFEAAVRNHTERVMRGVPSAHRNTQSNALHHWHTHMGQRRRQQAHLSDRLNRPVENLLMNQDIHFRETQEQKEFLSQAMPDIHSGYGYRVGSEFWSLPQRYGDDISGITATLTQTEQGRRGPVTHVGQPRSIRQESGIMSAESTTFPHWNWSDHLLQQCQELQHTDMKKPDISGLEVIGCGRPLAAVTVGPSPVVETQTEEHSEMKKENLDNLAQADDAVSDTLNIPVLRFCGQLASWTGSSSSNQKEVGISTTINFEVVTGKIASAHLELQNVGSTAIFYSWQQIHIPSSFPHLQLQSRRKENCFYFNTSPNVILPGATRHVEFLFKSELAGVKTELWQLNTHPVLLQGAAMQVKLKGYALHQDRTADQRLHLQMMLEKKVTQKMCRSIMYEMLQGVQTPERPSSPAELYITEEEEFARKNPKWQYCDKAVGQLKTLWLEVNPGHTWDLSVDTLLQAILSLPLQQSAQDTIIREQGLSRLNSLLLQLCEPSHMKHNHRTPEILLNQLWRDLLDAMADEATQLRRLLGLPVNETWIDKKDETLDSDADVADVRNKDEKRDKKAGAAAKEERNGMKSRLKDDNKGEAKLAATEKLVEKRKGEKRDDVGRGKAKQNQGKEPGVAPETLPGSTRREAPQEQNVDLARISIYKTFLHKKVYALMEDLVDTFCDLMDEEHEQDTLLQYIQNNSYIINNS
ncbi:MYCBP-associated protein isoform X2 [Betta splendens]|uniref:MYCBP-associated protein isoform X2 n=1 Tax=Betta splendens TaxID=158456 RepID=A0A6P7MER3_BETSP|nr:MYCBP-associated protein isoform X2 [Betta splendens]